VANIARLSLTSDKSISDRLSIHPLSAIESTANSSSSESTIDSIIQHCQTPEELRQFIQILEWNMQREIQATQFRFHKRRVPLYTALSEKTGM
jgi:hypothetical protein